MFNLPFFGDNVFEIVYTRSLFLGREARFGALLDIGV